MSIENKVDPGQSLLKLSASSIKSFEQCPRKYYFNYIQKAPKKQWAHFDLGNLCHKALEIFHKTYMAEGTTKRSLSQLMSYSFSIARKGFLNVNDEIMSDAKNMLMEYLQSVKNNGMPVVKGCETSFDFKVIENVIIRGFVDRIDILEDGKFRIIDYKTTKDARYLDKFQLLVYGLWLKEKHPHIECFQGAYVLLKHGSKIKEFDFNLQDIDKVREEIISYAHKIRTEKNWKPIPTRLCDWCDFKEICDAHKDTCDTNKSW
jgi:RecB family exonuclease